MKMLIFLVVLALLGTIVLWRVRKADAEKELARRRVMKQRKKQRKEAISTKEPVEWPVIIRPVRKHSEEDEADLPEPQMTSIQFEPADRTNPRH